MQIGRHRSIDAPFHRSLAIEPHIRMNLMNRWAQRWKHCLGVLGRARNQDKIIARILVERMIFRRPDSRIECAVPYVFNHADNRPDRFRSQVRIADLSADWILAWEILLSKG